MSADVFVHALFGVQVPQEFYTRIHLLEAKRLQEAEGADDEEFDDEELDDEEDDYEPEWFAAEKLTLKQEILAKLNIRADLEPELGLLYSGSEDARVGRCQVAPEEWFIGIGYINMVSASVAVRLALIAAGAEWFSWAEG
jgi:hypothetical protein